MSIKIQTIGKISVIVGGGMVLFAFLIMDVSTVRTWMIIVSLILYIVGWFLNDIKDAPDLNDIKDDPDFKPLRKHIYQDAYTEIDHLQIKKVQDLDKQINELHDELHVAIDALKPFAEINCIGREIIVAYIDDNGKKISEVMTFDFDVAKRIVENSNF